MALVFSPQTISLVRHFVITNCKKQEYLGWMSSSD